MRRPRSPSMARLTGPGTATSRSLSRTRRRAAAGDGDGDDDPALLPAGGEGLVETMRCEAC
ncbi:hypothetical protein ACEZCY_16260 [Streptacidiphilus sp. N1-12]|uniref:Uncharacterized protein n=2 Tax=Streptacidiphilus alkalitolerans TaxID=3342712 RepID=A0ABV6VAR2_9ACTN